MSQKKDKGTVAVAMSGGVDSSVAAALLSKSGYQVIGLTMRLWDLDPDGIGSGHTRGCCSTEAVSNAKRVCDKLNIPHYLVDLRQDFRHWVVDDFVSEYVKGHTPNPCIRCNTIIKWQSLWRKAQSLSTQYLATGHYARITHDSDGWKLHRAQDDTKDQSYALWGIPREKLSTTLFPLGEITKNKVRNIARELGLRTAEVPDSQDICFIVSESYGDFLRKHYPDQLKSNQPGEIIDQSGEVLGEHPGYMNYTVGQRKGLRISAAEKMYVLATNPDSNQVMIGPGAALEMRGLTALHINWLTEVPDQPFPATIQVRYRDRGVPGTVILSGDEVMVEFDDSHRGIAPGQSVVFYQGDCLLGGGIIKSAIPKNQPDVFQKLSSTQ